MITASLKVNLCAVNISSYYVNFLILNPSGKDETAFLKHLHKACHYSGCFLAVLKAFELLYNDILSSLSKAHTLNTFTHNRN